MFEGDNNDVIMWKQHDIYNNALTEILSGADRLGCFSRAVLDLSPVRDWSLNCDHRTIQGAHDILAAAWRYKFCNVQHELFEQQLNVNYWVDWLRNEIISWVNHPEIVKEILVILANQNTKNGYAAEARLCLALMLHYNDVPWRKNLYQAYEEVINNHKNEIQKN